MLKKILSLSQYPNIRPDADEPFMDRVATLVKAYSFLWLALIFIAAPLVSLTDVFVVHTLHFKSIQGVGKVSLRQMFQKTGYVFGSIYLCLLGPLLEETVFRLPLSFRKIHIAIGFAVAVFLLIISVPITKTLGLNLRICVILLKLAIPVGIFFIIKKLLPANIKLNEKAKKWLIITSMCLFGLMHIFNYSPLQWPIIWIYPIYVLPQFFMGWLMTYVRLKNGFIWGIALHCIINTGSMLLSPSFKDPVKAKPAHTITIPSKIQSCIKKQKELKDL
jgi:hypothetical protein